MRDLFLKTLLIPLILIIGIGFSDSCSAQQQGIHTGVDTLSNDSLNTLVDVDSLENSESFSPISYDADSSRINGRTVVFYGTNNKPARIDYQSMTLEASKITLYLNGDSLVAEGKTVAANPDSFPGGTRVIGRPVLDQAGQQPMTGLRMVYDLNTQRARVHEGRTQFEGGFYYGENIVRLSPEFLQISDGYYTSCDKEGPHFHFKSSRMKLKIKDKVVARPVIFYIQDVPLFLLPFGVFPITGGRSSGFIMPTYGESRREGRHLRGFGYYYAPNDYIDGKLLLDFFEKQGLFLRGDMRYSVRYKMSGNISGSVSRGTSQALDFLGRPAGGSKTEERSWDVRINHRQIISPTMNLSVSGRFMSSESFNKQFSFDRDIRTQSRIQSTARLSKQWEESKNSMSISLSRTQDLESGAINETLPSISFNRSTPTYLFRDDEDNFGTGAQKKRFYTDLNFRYDAKLENRLSKFIEGSFTDTLITIPDDQELPPDTTEIQRNTFGRERRSGVQHKLSINMPTRILQHFTVGLSASYREDWMNEAVVKQLGEDNKVVSEIENGFFARRTGSLSVSANTKLFGMFNMNVGRLKTIRHVMTPSVSLTYRPDFSNEIFGYYDTYTDSLGEEIEYDRFAGSLFGATSKNRSLSMGISLQNLIQARTVKDSVESKFDFLKMSSSTSYNLAAPDSTKRLSNLNSTVRLPSLGNLNFSTTHSFYDVDSTGRETIQSLFNSNAGIGKLAFLRLTRISTSTSFEFSGGEGDSDSGQDQTVSSDAFEEEEVITQAAQIDQQDRFETTRDLTDQAIPWKLSGGLTMAINRNNPTRVTKTLSSRAKLEVQATENWRVGYAGQFNILKKKISYQDISVRRDLHCWEFNFSWTPPGSFRSGFWLEIRVKEPKLRDLKVETKDYGGSALGSLR